MGRFGQSSRKIETVITISVTITVITNTNYLAGFKREKQLKLRWIKVSRRAVDLFDWRVGLKMFNVFNMTNERVS